MDRFVFRTQLTKEKLKRISYINVKLKKKKTIRKHLINISISTLLTCIMFGYFIFHPNAGLEFTRYLVWFGVIIIVLSVFFQFKYMKTNKWMLGNEIIYSIGEEGIEIQHINGNTSLKWDAFTRWTEDADYLYLCEHSQYIILEKTLFLNNEELRFKELLNRKIGKQY